MERRRQNSRMLAGGSQLSVGLQTVACGQRVESEPRAPRVGTVRDDPVQRRTYGYTLATRGNTSVQWLDIEKTPTAHLALSCSKGHGPQCVRATKGSSEAAPERRVSLRQGAGMEKGGTPQRDDRVTCGATLREQQTHFHVTAVLKHVSNFSFLEDLHGSYTLYGSP